MEWFLSNALKGVYWVEANLTVVDESAGRLGTLTGRNSKVSELEVTQIDVRR